MRVGKLVGWSVCQETEQRGCWPAQTLPPPGAAGGPGLRLPSAPAVTGPPPLGPDGPQMCPVGAIGSHLLHSDAGPVYFGHQHPGVWSETNGMRGP